MKEYLDKVKFATTKSLTRLIMKALDDARLQIEAQAMRFVGAKLPPIAEESQGITERFITNLHNYFEELTTLVVKDEEIEPDSYDNLSLVDHDYLEAMIAMEGMVKQLRDGEIKGMRSLLTRLETMFPNIRIDQTNNPLDPEQVGDCFNEAIKPLGFKAHYLLTIYREFNKTVFGQYQEVIREANETLAELGILPDLDITARERELRKQKRAEARAQLEAEQKAKAAAEAEELAARMKKPATAAKPAEAPAAPAPAATQAQAEMFSMMQTLVKSLADRQAGGGFSATAGAEVSTSIAMEQEDLRRQQHKLMSMLTDIQSSMINGGASNSGAANVSSVAKSINESLKAGQSSGDIGAISVQSGDVINLVTMLYEAIWKDEALPVVMKELIGRTQIAIMKVALGDTDFFDNENHPGRALLNELALAGISWTQTASLAEDPVYQKVKSLVERLLGEPEPDNAFLQGLIDELSASRGEKIGADFSLEKRVRESSVKNPDDIHAYVRQKIYERVLKGYLDPAVKGLLDTHLHEFLVKLVMKEGPEGKSWKPVMSTIDVLLWTVQAEKQPGDKARFDRINPRLVDNLSKALEIGGASKTKITKIMRQIKQIQEFTFHQASHGVKPPSRQISSMADEIRLATAGQKDVPPLPRNDPHLRRIDKLPIGAWVEFRGNAGQRIRCSLASKIDSIDKLFFADSEGHKVIELTRMRLAHELKANGVKIISEGTLVNRAMESVVSNLKQSANESKPREIATG